MSGDLTGLCLYMGVCGFFLSVKFDTSILASLAGGIITLLKKWMKQKILTLKKSRKFRFSGTPSTYTVYECSLKLVKPKSRKFCLFYSKNIFEYPQANWKQSCLRLFFCKCIIFNHFECSIPSKKVLCSISQKWSEIDCSLLDSAANFFPRKFNLGFPPCNGKESIFCSFFDFFKVNVK